MSDDIKHIDVDSDEFEGTPKALRDHVKKLQKTNAELTQQITGFKTEKVETALADVLAGFTKPERVKSALLADGIDPLDTEAVGTWMQENGDDFARATPADPSTPDSIADAADQRQSQRAALDAINSIGQPGSPNSEALLKAAPPELHGRALRQWIVENVPGA